VISSESPSAVVIPLPAFEVEHNRSDLSRPTRIPDSEYDGIIFDTHVHLLPPDDVYIDQSELRKIIEILKNEGIDLAVFMPTPNEGRREFHEEGVRQRKMLVDFEKNRIKLFCGGNYITYWLHCTYHNGHFEEELELRNILTRLSKDIDSGEYTGVGEIGISHFRKLGKQPVIRYPPNFEPFLSIVDLIAEKRMWVDLHAEPVDPTGISYEEQVFGGIELLFQRNPNLQLIYSHTAMTNPTNVRRILLKYPNVMMNIKVIRHHYRWRNLEPITNDPKGELYEDWAELFEEMPGRFMIGTDSKFGPPPPWLESKDSVFQYKEKIKEMRGILGTLNPKSARLIAHENAQKIFGID